MKASVLVEPAVAAAGFSTEPCDVLLAVTMGGGVVDPVAEVVVVAGNGVPWIVMVQEQSLSMLRLKVPESV